MKQITLTLTVEELRLLAALASDQLFRREFIDPRFPGYRADPAEVGSGKALVERIRSIIAKATAEKPAAPAEKPAAAANARAAGATSRRQDRAADAV